MLFVSDGVKMKSKPTAENDPVTQGIMGSRRRTGDALPHPLKAEGHKAL